MAEKIMVSCYDGTMVKVGDRMVRFDKGAAIAPGADEDHVKVLLERGMVEEGEPSGGFAHDPTAQAPFKVDDEKPARGRQSKVDDEKPAET